MRFLRQKLPKLNKNEGNDEVVDDTVNDGSGRQTDNRNLNAYGSKNNQRDVPEDDVPPGLDGSGPPGLEGNGPPGLDGSDPPDLVVSTTEETVVSPTSSTSTTYSFSPSTVTETSQTMATSATDSGLSITTLLSTKATPTTVLAPGVTHPKPSESTYQLVAFPEAPTSTTPNLKSSITMVRTTPEMIVSRTAGLQTTTSIPTKVVYSKVAPSIMNMSSGIDVYSTTIEATSSGAPSPTKAAGDINNGGIETLTSGEAARLVIEGTIVGLGLVAFAVLLYRRRKNASLKTFFSNLLCTIQQMADKVRLPTWMPGVHATRGMEKPTTQSEKSFSKTNPG